jgi:hypothetical protein
MGTAAPSLVYGEICFEALAEVFFRHLTLPKKGGVFYDLGSGTGMFVSLSFLFFFLSSSIFFSCLLISFQKFRV